MQFIVFLLMGKSQLVWWNCRYCGVSVSLFSRRHYVQAAVTFSSSSRCSEVFFSAAGSWIELISTKSSSDRSFSRWMSEASRTYTLSDPAALQSWAVGGVSFDKYNSIVEHRVCVVYSWPIQLVDNSHWKRPHCVIDCRSPMSCRAAKDWAGINSSLWADKLSKW